jgi:hypothetical protein
MSRYYERKSYLLTEKPEKNGKTLDRLPPLIEGGNPGVFHL